MATVVSTIFIASCADDVYDPSKERPTPPAENPFGEGFAAPDGFSWSMMNTVNLNVEVKDEEGGQYQYLIEVFTTNPILDNSAQPIAAGLAKGESNYMAEVNLPKTVESLYIRQTDPRQRKEVYQFAVPENGGTLSSKLYYNNTTTRSNGTAGSTAAADAAPASMNAPDDPNYQENKIFVNIPDASSGVKVENWGVTFEADAKLVIGNEYTEQNPFNRSLQGVNNARASIYVKGTWKLSTALNWDSHNFDIYVLNGGKIIVEGSNPTIGNPTRLYIATGGALESSVSELKLGSQSVVNFGSIIAKSITTNQGADHAIYNAGSILTTGNFHIHKTIFINKGDIEVKDLLDISSNNKMLNTGKINTQNINLIATVINNFGEITFNTDNGTASTNNTTGSTGIVNHYEGIIKGYHWKGGLSLYNDGFIEMSYFENGSVDVLYNSCTLIVKERFLFQNLTLDNGSVTGGKPDNFNSSENNANLWKPVPEIGNNGLDSSGSPIKLVLKNGSMIKADLFKITSAPNDIKGEGDAKSLLQFKEVHINNGGSTTLTGNLVSEIGKFTYGSGINGIHNGKWIAEGIPITGWDESKYSISTCGGYYKPGEPGKPDPSNPDFPIVTEDATNYTFAFEDNWPTYGDFDMNDIIATIDKVTVTQNVNSSVESYKIEGTLQAVGASKKLGLGIQFLGFNANTVTAVNGIVQGMASSAPLTFEGNQSKPVLIISTDAHRFLGNAQDDREYINTINGSDNNKNGAKFEVSLTFKDGAVTPADININKLDMFVISRDAASGNKRMEIHLAGFAPTDLGNTGQFGNGNDNSSAASNRYYLSKENLAWGIVVPNNFAWPLEYANIKDVYSKFTSWVTSAGKENKDWYNNHNGQVFKK